MPAVAAFVAACLLGLVAVNPPARAENRLVLVYGDSLVYEAQRYAEHILRDVANVDYRIVGVPGAATCDLLPRMREDAARFAPAFVVIAFSGNTQTECMKDANGNYVTGDAWLARYRADSIEAVVAFRRTGPPIWFSTAPITLVAEKRSEDGERRLAGMLRELASLNPRVHVADGGAAVLDNGWWTRTLPCLRNEPCEGGVDTQARRVNVVRAPDGGHFCPVGHPRMHDCPVHASGALRYALGFLAPPLRSQGLYDPGRADRSLAAGWSG